MKSFERRFYKWSKWQLISMVKSKFPNEDFTCIHLLTKTQLLRLAIL